jgi:hypothetical protein
MAAAHVRFTTEWRSVALALEAGAIARGTPP